MAMLEGKVAIITGAGRGLGKGMALAFAEEGAKVVVADIKKQTANTVAEQIKQLGKTALAVTVDVGNREQVQKMVYLVIREFGSIDILVNNAQLFDSRGPIELIKEENWDRVFQTGVKATWYCCTEVLPYMKERGGKIINFSSRNGIVGLSGCCAYNANTEAIRGFTRTAAREWGKYKINVNVICPFGRSEGAIAWEKAFPEDYKKALAATTLGHDGDPEKDVGGVAVFLASTYSDYLTGHTFMADGGEYIF